MATLYGELDVLVAPSIWPESYGLVTREALAAGLWVVASDRGAIGSDIIEGVNGHLIDVGNAEALSKVLEIIDSNQARYTTRPKFDFVPRPIREQTDELFRLYQAACANSRRGQPSRTTNSIRTPTSSESSADLFKIAR